MTLEDEINKCLINLSNADKALNIAKREIKNAADRLAIAKQKPELKIVKNESLGEALAKEISDDARLKHTEK